MLRKVAFTMYPVKEVDRARDFYENKLGLTPGAVGNHDGQYWIEYDLPGGGCLALTNVTPAQPSEAAGGTVAFEVDDLDGFVADLKGREVTFRSDVIDTPVCRMAVCVDSEGNSFLLHQIKRRS
jgi:predicted enzyme related to lactoylglutathione lyase